MKSVLISIQPKWVEKIANGEKTIEVRKTAPKCEVPFKCYIYVTKCQPYLYRVDDDNNFELTNTLRPEVDEYVKDYNEQNGKVIGEFVCDEVERLEYQEKYLRGITSQTAIKYFQTKIKSTALSVDEIEEYGKGKTLYGWHISDLKIYDKPKELSEFKRPLDMPTCGYTECGTYETPYCKWLNTGCEKRIITRAPQSWQYVEEI